MFEEYHLSKFPSIYPEEYVLEILHEEIKVNYGMKVFVSDMHLVRDPEGYEEHLRRKIATEFGHKMLDDGKICISMYEHPTFGDKEMLAESYVFTKKEIYDLLGRFGIYIKMRPTLNK